MGGITKSVKRWVKSPGKIISSLAKGDISGAIGGAASAASLGTIGSGGGFVDTEKYMPSTEALKAQEKQATQAAQAAHEQAKKADALEKQEEQRRKSIFFTSGNELGEMLYSTSRKRRGSILGN